MDLYCIYSGSWNLSFTSGWKFVKQTYLWHISSSFYYTTLILDIDVQLVLCKGSKQTWLESIGQIIRGDAYHKKQLGYNYLQG